MYFFKQPFKCGRLNIHYLHGFIIKLRYKYKSMKCHLTKRCLPMSSYFVLFLKQTISTPYTILQTPPSLFPLAKLAVRCAAPARPPCGLGRQEKNRPRYAAVFFPAKPCLAAASVSNASGKHVWRPVEPPMSNLKTSDYGKELSIGMYQANRQTPEDVVVVKGRHREQPRRDTRHRHR